MKNFLKENWFKLIIAIALLIVVISVAYYFISNSSKPSQTMSSEDILSNQQKCAEQASKAYIAEGYGSGSSDDLTNYVNHYNQKLNKCFIEIYDLTPSTLSSISLIDAYELKEYANYMYFFKGNGGAANPVCSLDEQIADVSTRIADCTSQAGFENYAATYMEN